LQKPFWTELRNVKKTIQKVARISVHSAYLPNIIISATQAITTCK
jgi:hypothetical protein